MTNYSDRIKEHYIACWSNKPSEHRWHKGPTHQLPTDFCVLEFRPTKQREMWTYATCSMWQPKDEILIELHLFSPAQYSLHIELLTVIAHYHRTGSALDLGPTVSFGRPWMDGSKCTYGLISLPYLDGPNLEDLVLPDQQVVKCLWLIPITKAERDFKKIHGLETLEQEFEKSEFDFLNPKRPSIV